MASCTDEDIRDPEDIAQGADDSLIAEDKVAARDTIRSSASLEVAAQLRRASERPKESATHDEAVWVDAVSVLKDSILELVQVAERLSARSVKLAAKLRSRGRSVEVSTIKEDIGSALLASKLHDASDLLNDARLLRTGVLRIDDILHRDAVLGAVDLALVSRAGAIKATDASARGTGRTLQIEACTCTHKVAARLEQESTRALRHLDVLEDAISDEL